MSLERYCKEGKIEIGQFFEFVAWRMPRRTHLLDAGDYVVIPHPYQKDHVDVEEIAGLDSPERGDFVTVRGTTGPINGNIFIKINKGRYPEHLLIEGESIGKPTCPVPVYDLINEYLENRCSRN